MNAYNYIAFSVTNKCNTVCRYCFKNCKIANDGFLPLETMERCLDRCAKKAGNKMVAQFTGGEPLLHPDIWKILRYAGERGFSLRLQTNGLLFDRMIEANLKLLAQPHQVFKISLDGYDEATHEEMRAKGTFRQIMRGIEMVRHYRPRYCVKTVLSPIVAANFQKMLDLSLSIGAAGISYNFLRPEGKAKNLANPVNELEFTRQAIELFNQDKYRHLLNGSKVLEAWLYPQSFIRPNFFYVNYDGNVYPSQDALPSECIGNANLGAECLIDENLAPQRWEVSAEIHQLVKERLKIGATNFACLSEQKERW